MCIFYAEVLKSERDVGRKQYDQSQDKIKETIAFGRRSEGPPCLYYPASREALLPTKPGTRCKRMKGAGCFQ